MRLHAESFSASAAAVEYEDMAFFFARAGNGYCFSLSRPVGSAQVEVLVQDQLTFKTAELSAKLSGSSLLVCLPQDAAAHLDGNTEYEVLFSASSEQLYAIDGALRAVFKDIERYATEF